MLLRVYLIFRTVSIICLLRFPLHQDFTAYFSEEWFSCTINSDTGLEVFFFVFGLFKVKLVLPHFKTVLKLEPKLRLYLSLAQVSLKMRNINRHFYFLTNLKKGGHFLFDRFNALPHTFFRWTDFIIIFYFKAFFLVLLILSLTQFMHTF